MNDLKELKLPSFVQHWERLATEAVRGRQSHPEYLKSPGVGSLPRTW